MRFLAALLLTALAASAQTNILKVSFADLGLEVRANRKIELRGVQTNLSAPYIISREYKSALTDTNGVCRFTNVVAGAYDLSLASTPPTIVRIGVTNSGTNVMEAYGLVNVASDGNAVQGYTQAAADARFYLRSNPSNYVTASITNGLGGGGGTTYTNANIRVGLISGSSIGTNTSLLLSTNEFYSASNSMVSAWTASDAGVTSNLTTKWTWAHVGDLHLPYDNSAALDPSLGVVSIAWRSNSFGSIVSNKSALNVKALLSHGDLIDNSAQSVLSEFYASKLATVTNLLYKFLTNGIPVYTGAGNHEGTDWGTNAGTDVTWDAMMGPVLSYPGSGFVTTSSWGGFRQCIWLQTNAATKFCIVSADSWASNRTDWVRYAATNYPDHYVVVLTHIETGTHGNILYSTNDATGSNGGLMWSKLENDLNIVGVWSGHQRASHMWAHETRGGVNHIFLNTQHATNTGGNYVRYYEIDPANNFVKARTWDNLGAVYMTNGIATYWPSKASNGYYANFTVPLVPNRQIQNHLVLTGPRGSQKSDAVGPGTWGAGTGLNTNEPPNTFLQFEKPTALGQAESYVFRWMWPSNNFELGFMPQSKWDSPASIVPVASFTTNSGGTVAAGAFAGDGSGLTSLQTTNLIGTMPTNYSSINITNTSDVQFRIAAARVPVYGESTLSMNWAGAGGGTASVLSGGNISLFLDNDTNGTSLFRVYNDGLAAVLTASEAGLLQASNVTLYANGTFTGNGSGLTNLPASQLTGMGAALTGVSITNLDAIGTLESDPITVWPNGFQVTNTGSGLYAPITIGAENESVIWVNKIMNGAGDTIPRVNLAHSAIEGFLTNQSTLFIGGGSGLTNLNASQLTTGTVPAGRLTTAGTNLVGAVLTSDGVGNRYWTNAITNFSSVAATNLIAGSSVTAGSSTITTSLIRSAGSMYVGSGASLIFDWGNQDASILRHSIGTIRVRTNAVVDGYISSTNGFVDVPRSSAPTFAQIGSRTNTPVMWWSNSAPCVRYVTYYDASSNAVTTNLFSLP